MACFYSAPLAWNPTGVDTGEMYKTPTGAWEKRSGAPQRLAACIAN